MKKMAIYTQQVSFPIQTSILISSFSGQGLVPVVNNPSQTYMFSAFSSCQTSNLLFWPSTFEKDVLTPLSSGFNDDVTIEHFERYIYRVQDLIDKFQVTRCKNKADSARRLSLTNPESHFKLKLHIRQ